VQANLSAMKKRVAAALLWFYTTWYAWAMVASVIGLSDLFGPVLGAVVAAVIAGDPMHRIWGRAAERATVTSTAIPATAR
jgi:hypothetical protein